MLKTSCPQCGKSLETLAGAAFCPFCGGSVTSEAHSAEHEPEAVRRLLEQLEKMSDPRKKHELLLAAEKEYPQSLSVAQELLFLGRLYERGGKNVDFSIIKCYLYNLYLDPGQFTEKRQNELRTELLSHPLLLKCLALCEDQDAFMRLYLLRLSGEFIRLFLHGDSRYMRRLFGFALPDSRAPKMLAGPVASMLLTMSKDEMLSLEQRDMLMQTLYQAFSKEMAGETTWLDEKLQKAGVTIFGTT